MAFNTLWPRIVGRFKPDAVVVQTGTDILMQDPLGKLKISNRLFIELVAQIKNSAPRNAHGTPRLVVLGGGGYHPQVLARCWTGVWSVLSGWDLPSELPDEGRRLLKNIVWKDESDSPSEPDLFQVRLDEPIEGPIRKSFLASIDELLQQHPFFQMPKPVD